MHRVDKVLQKITENSQDMTRKINEEGATLSSLSDLIEQTKALINELCDDDNSNVRRLGRANMRLFKAALQAQKLRERGNYTDRQLRRHMREVLEARKAVEEVTSNGI